jgi:hypothetical protein
MTWSRSTSRAVAILCAVLRLGSLRPCSMLAIVTSAVFHAVAFLEGVSNEEYDLNRLQILEIAGLWQRELADTSCLKTLEKFQKYLTLSVGSPFNRGTDQVYKNVATLVYLREKLIHYKPIWEATIPKPTQGDLSDLQRRLKGLKRKIMMNPFVSLDSQFLDRYLGHGCTAWVVRTAVDFADAFYGAVGLTAPYEWARDRVTTE